MKIAIDARIISSSTGRYVERLLFYLQQIDTTNQYVVLLRAKDVIYWRPTNPNFSVVVADFKNYSFAEQTKLKKLLKSLQLDLVHFCMPQQPLGYRGARVTTIHDLTLLKTYNSDKNWLAYHLKQLVGRHVFKSIARLNHFIFTPSEYTKQEYMKFSGIDSRKVQVTYEAADVTSTSPEPLSLPFKRYILYVGQQSDYKNIKRLGDAHQKLLKSYPDLGLVLVGSKNTASHQNETYFNDKNYKNIFFPGFVSDAQLAWLYKNTEAYIFPSLMEGFGLPGLEAMSYGAPVISSNATCLPEIYQDAAYYFNPKDTNDIVRAIDTVLNDKELRDNLVVKGYEQLRKYSWQRMAEQTHAVYMKAVGITSSPERWWSGDRDLRPLKTS